MQIVFESAGGVRDVDVNVQVPDATVGDLLAALGCPPGAGARGITVDGRFFHVDLALTEVGLHDGAIVRVGISRGPMRPASQHGPVLAVVGGLEAGQRVRLRAGQTVIGRDAACDVTLTSPTSSARHCATEVDHLGRVTVTDLGSRNGTWIDDDAVTEPRTLLPGQILGVGGVDLMLLEREPDDRPVGLGQTAHRGVNVPFNRPPRAAPPAESAPIALPKPPREAPASTPLPWIGMVAPLVIGVAVAVLWQQTYFLLFALLSPVLLVGNWVEGRRRGQRVSRQEAARFAEGLAAFREQLEQRRIQATARAREQLPDLSEVIRRATCPSVRLWERRQSDPDFLRLSAGFGAVPWQPPLSSDYGERPGEVTAALAEAAHLTNAPVVIDLANGGVVGIAGDRSAALALARALVCQAAVHHGPADLRVAVLADSDQSAVWEWTKWLPHTHDPEAGGGSRLLADQADDIDALLRDLLEAGQGRDSGPVLFTVVDASGLTEGKNAPARAVLRGGAGPAAGIVLAATTDRLPAVCTTVVELLDPHGTANLARPQRGEAVEGLASSGITVETARACALALARFEDPETGTAGASLPSRVDLAALFEDDVFDPEAVARRWHASRNDLGLTVPIGVTEDDVLTLDLVRDGPHGLVGGTTGSGKSELLRSLIVALALGADPQRLNFVLIDYKGGSAFNECARLPHTVGFVTDLDAHLGERALRCLQAELGYRKRLLRQAGADDLDAYRRLPAAKTPLPRLMVVIDEFAKMAADLPDFITGLVRIAEQGRSLGVHLLLAAQRPSGAVSDNIRANTNLRIALRVQEVGDSTDVIGVPTATQIGRDQPGRAYVRLSQREVVPIQTALVTGVSHKSGGRIDVAPFTFGRRLQSQQVEQEPGGGTASDLERLVDAVRTTCAAAEMPEPRRPWPEPLPTDLSLNAITDPGSVVRGAALVALADDPDAQTQYPVGWDLASGNLLLYGLRGSGITTTLASLALSLAAGAEPDDLHLYVLDFDAGGLSPLEGLPHTGAVITATEGERQRRLIRWLRGELDRRREMGAARRHEPRLFLLLDGYAAFKAEYDDPRSQWATEALTRIVAEGPSLGIATVVTADRTGAVPAALSSTVSQKWLFRLAEPYDYATFQVKYQPGSAFPPGRALVAGNGQAIQIGRPAHGLADAVARIAAAAPAATRPPTPIGTLPAAVRPSVLRDAVHLAEHPWALPVGIAESTLAPAVLHLHAAEHALIAGPARSGRSGLLCALAQLIAATGSDIAVIAIAPRPSPLRESGDVDRIVTKAESVPDVLREVGETGGRQVLLIDDADSLEDPANAIDQLLGRHLPGVHLIVAGRADVLRSRYTGWTQRVRASGAGVLLRPDPDLDWELLKVPRSRRAPAAVTVGRGWLVNDGEVEFIQAATTR